MDDRTQTLNALPLSGIAAAAVALIVFRAIRVKLHAFLVLVLVSLLTAIAAGFPLENPAGVLVSTAITPLIFAIV